MTQLIEMQYSGDERLGISLLGFDWIIVLITIGHGSVLMNGNKGNLIKKQAGPQTRRPHVSLSFHSCG